MGNCSYCNTESQIICGECNKTFCNNTTENISHLIFHLVKHKHKHILINNKSINCCICGNKNIFRMCEYQEMYYCISCKDNLQMVANKKLKNYVSEESHIKEIKDLKDSESTCTLPKIRLNIKEKDYVKTFVPLIVAESLKEREMKEQMKQDNVSMRFNGNYCYFNFNRRSVTGMKISIGDEIKITHKAGISLIGFVCEDQFTEELEIEVKVELREGIETGEYPRHGYSVEFTWKGVCYDRMIWAIKKLYKERHKNPIFDYILNGKPRDAVRRAPAGEKGEQTALLNERTIFSSKGRSNAEREIPAQNLVETVLEPGKLHVLNDSQKTAVKAAMNGPLTLIQGPPGTGKTVVSAVIVFNLVRQLRKKVLVAASSNTAADQLALKMNSAGLKVLRVMSTRKAKKSSEVDFLCLHTLAKELNDKTGAMQHELISLAEVVCCTCATAGQRIFNDHKFPFVLIDEAVQSTEPLSLIPCAYGAQKLILVGDHKQLGPTILDQNVSACGFRQSLFERLLRKGTPSYMLSVQYRMHPDLCQFPSECFYDGRLTSGTNLTKCLNFPNNFFYVCNGKEEVSPNGASFYNKSEALVVENIIRFLFKNGVSEQQIGVITPYEGQRTYILSKIFENEPGNLDISNIDGFQGREKDFIIVSLVRSNNFQGIGFVADNRRMNVALTRAKHGLIIVGNPFTLYKNKMWARLLDFYEQKGNIYDGPVNCLRKTTLKGYDMRALSDALQ